MSIIPRLDRQVEAYVYTSTYASTYLCMHACMHACMAGWMDGFAGVSIYIYTHTFMLIKRVRVALNPKP